MLLEKYNKLNKENSNFEKIDRYLKTTTLKRLKGKGMFCGMDYISLNKIKPIEYYSRYEHSKNVAYTASKLTDDFKIVLAGLFHDVGTLSFAHVNSFKKGEALTQDNDELNVKNILLQDEELLEYLREDGINIDDVICSKNYPLIDKEIPSLCLDRVDGILSTCLFWIHTHSLDEVKKLYYLLSYFENLNGMNIDYNNERLKNFNGEIVLSENNLSASYEDFFKAINNYSRILLSKEDRYMMSVLGFALNYYEDIGLINEQDLFYLSEEEIIAKILDSKNKDVWLDITSFDKVRYAKDETDGLALISKPKIRQANPLCLGQMEVTEIDSITGKFYRELNPLEQEIKLTDELITGNLSKKTVKTLIKYKK